MKKKLISKLKNSFEETAYEENGIEYWLARDLQVLLGYSDWRNCLNAINKAKKLYKNALIDPDYHFVDVNKMIKLPLKGGTSLAAKNVRILSQGLTRLHKMQFKKARQASFHSLYLTTAGSA